MIYQGNGWEIRVGRWQDSAPDSVDVVISDPPYDDDTSLGARSSKDIDSRMVQFMGIDPMDVGPAMIERARRWIVLFCAAEQFGTYKHSVHGMRTNGGGYVRSGIWSKPNPVPQFTADRPSTWGEGIAIMHKPGGRMRWNGGGKPARWTVPVESGFRGTHRVHETQKPLQLMMVLVSDFSEEGELVWDPYCGSGTTGVACLRLGRKFLGHEMQPHYAEVAAERLRAEERGLSLRDSRAGQLSIMDAMEG